MQERIRNMNGNVKLIIQIITILVFVGGLIANAAVGFYKINETKEIAIENRQRIRELERCIPRIDESIKRIDEKIPDLKEIKELISDNHK